MCVYSEVSFYSCFGAVGGTSRALEWALRLTTGLLSIAQFHVQEPQVELLSTVKKTHLNTELTGFFTFSQETFVNYFSLLKQQCILKKTELSVWHPMVSDHLYSFGFQNMVNPLTSQLAYPGTKCLEKSCNGFLGARIFEVAFRGNC